MQKVNQETYALVLKALLDDPHTAHELAELSGLHSVTAQSLMRCLKKHKVVHISAWESNSRGCDATPVYKLGKGRDVPRRRQSRAEIAQRYRLRKQQKLLTIHRTGIERNEPTETQDGQDT